MGSCVWAWRRLLPVPGPSLCPQAGVAVSPDRGCPSMLPGRGLACPAAEAPRGGSETFGVREAAVEEQGRACSPRSAASIAQDPTGLPETALGPDLRG